MAVVYGLTRLKREASAGMMLLAAVAVNFFFSSLILLLQYTADFYGPRRIPGPERRRLLPATILFGGAFLVASDTVARTAFAPAELPVGIFTSFLGGPFFLWLLLKPSRIRGEHA